MAEEYNPFIGSDEVEEHHEDGEKGFTHVIHIQTDGSAGQQTGTRSSDRVGAHDERVAHLPTEQKYTSLDEHPSSMMSSVSIDEDPGRFSALLEDDDPDAVRDLFVKVDKPEKHVEGYVSYNVTTKTTRGQYDQPEYCVRRRYQDFLWLRNRLEASNQTSIIPALPEKFTFSKHFDRFETDFLKTRQKALDKFLNRLADHPVMSFSDHLKTFLTAKAWEMTSTRKHSSGLMTKVGGSMKNVATQWMLKNRPPEFTYMVEYNTHFQKKIQTFGVIAEEVAKERFYLLEDLEEYGSAFRLWSNSETKLATPLSAIAFSVDKNMDALKSLLRIHDLRIAEPIREYFLYCESVKVALKRRDQLQLEYEVAMEELNKLRKDKDETLSNPQPKTIATVFGKDPDKVKEEKLEKLEEQIKDLIAESEALSDTKERADHDLKADMDRWQKNKRRDLKTLLYELSERHIRYYESCLNAWQDALDAVSGPKAKDESEC